MVFRKEIQAAEDPKAARREKIQLYSEQFATPYMAASRGFVDLVIRPSETRARLLEALELLINKERQPHPRGICRCKELKRDMGIIPYTAMTYGLTAVISLLVVAIIVGISKLTSRPGQTDDGEGSRNMEFFMQLFPGIGTFFAVEPVIAVARIVLIVFGFVLACLGFKRTLEPLIMVPMGIGMMAVNCGMMFLTSGTVGNLLLDPLVSDASAIVDAMQVNFLQPIYNLTFSNGLIACLVFMGIGARSEISFLLAKPWSSMIIAIFAEMGTFAALAAGVLAFGLTPEQSAAMATIGGADGPMVLFSSLMMAPELFVPISIIAYLYLSLTYGGYPYIIKLMVPKKYRGIDMYVEVPEVSQKSKFLFIIITCTVLCLSAARSRSPARCPSSSAWP
ncbi:MAG: sodium ion-translocating decarboxylase subunit beta [Flavonifractor plautii]